MLKIFIPLIGLLIFLNTSYFWMNLMVTMMMGMVMFLLNYSCWGILSMKLSQWSMMDSVSFLLILLTIWMCMIMIICSFKYMYMHLDCNLFSILILSLLIILMMSFIQSNILLFYIYFEFSLIPTMWLIMKWGYQPERLQASMYLMMYTIMGSLPMLSCLLFMVTKNCSFSFFMWFMFMDSNIIESWWLLFILGFLIKLPMYPFHLWLPKAHVEAPVAGSVILASILLKLGGYGIIRMGMVFPWLNLKVSLILFSFGLMGGMISSLICLRQIDLKSLIAYSSVGHMGLMMIGALSSCKIGLLGSVMMMVAHGFSSSALFMLANMNYESCNSRSMLVSKGILLMIPSISFFWFIFSIMNMAAPPFVNLISEIFIIMSMASISSFSLLLLGLISFLTLCYSLNMYSMINHGIWSNYLNSYKMLLLKEYTSLTFMLIPVLMLVMKLEI
uniref:NADH-ubiquinone oxidoreductase chain 4 n=1 Tax=Hirudo medicinalis TaxID=6421 RepID=A0A342KB27_HIRME|nr:NADH dehydrogenase subunit 4 [Hirudo medicinalis]